MKNNSSVETLWKRALEEKIVLNGVKSAAALHQRAITKRKRKPALASESILPDAIKIPLVVHTLSTLFPATCFIWISSQREGREGVHLTALRFPEARLYHAKIFDFCVFLEVETSKETQDKQQPCCEWLLLNLKGAGGLFALGSRTMKVTTHVVEEMMACEWQNLCQNIKNSLTVSTGKQNIAKLIFIKYTVTENISNSKNRSV